MNKNNKKIKISKGIAAFLSATTILASCAKKPQEKVVIKDDVDNEIFMQYENDEIFKALCEDGYILVENDNLKVEYYKTNSLMLVSAEDKYYLCSLHQVEKDVLYGEKIDVDYENYIPFRQTSAMYELYKNEMANLTYDGNFKFCLKVKKDKLINYVQNWDQQINKNYNQVKKY